MCNLHSFLTSMSLTITATQSIKKNLVWFHILCVLIYSLGDCNSNVCLISIIITQFTV